MPTASTFSATSPRVLVRTLLGLRAAGLEGALRERTSCVSAVRTASAIATSSPLLQPCLAPARLFVSVSTRASMTEAGTEPGASVESDSSAHKPTFNRAIRLCL